MKKKQSAIASALVIALILLFSGCPNEPEEDLSVGEVTIINIPAKIVEQSSAATNGIERNAFKVYLNASNSMNDEEEGAQAAQGTAFLSGPKNTETANQTAVATLIDGKYTVTMKLYRVPGDYLTADPDSTHGGAFYGEARYFSLVLCPEDAPNSGTIWIKGSMNALNKAQTVIDWGGSSLSDFRAITNDPSMQWLEDQLKIPQKTKRLYNAIVCKDDDIQNAEIEP